MSTTRDLILKTILNQKRVSINELAHAVGINPISVRHHIVKLEAQQLVESEDERHGVGRPRRVYFLTQTGLERFPTRYLDLTNRLLEQVKETFPQAIVANLFTEMGEAMASRHASDLQGLSMEDRLAILQEVLQHEGFTIEWEARGEEFYIKELNCPYYHIGQIHPEICSVDQTLISTFLSTPAIKTQCILDGDEHCTYVVSNAPPF